MSSSDGMTHRIHYKFLVYHCHGSNCGDPANSTSSDCHQAEVSVPLPRAVTSIAPLSQDLLGPFKSGTKYVTKSGQLPHITHLTDTISTQRGQARLS